MKFKNVITKVDEGSIAEELGIEAGDELITINGNQLQDIFDYMYIVKDEYLDILILKENGEEWLLEIEKDEDEDLGLSFKSGLMDDMRSCNNNCIFCFIDQLPRGVAQETNGNICESVFSSLEKSDGAINTSRMRESLYFKDDDSRLCFLSGNYVTLTNLNDKDFERVLFYKFSPINISVHTTDLELRAFMLNNKNAKKILNQIKKIADAGISMNFQVVLIKGLNDLDNLDKTINDLKEFIPFAQSLSIVPVGITKYREQNNLYKLEPFNKEDAISVVSQVEQWQKKLKKEFSTNFVFLSDEFYLKAEKEIPFYKHYEDFVQIENGVGMLSCFRHEFYEALKQIRPVSNGSKKAVITGVLAYDLIKELAIVSDKRYNTNTEVFCIENNFFGEHITVSGLLTGRDIIKQIKGKTLAKKILIPENVFKKDEYVLLDDITLQDLERELEAEILVVKKNGGDFLSKLLE